MPREGTREETCEEATGDVQRGDGGDLLKNPAPGGS